MKENNMKLTDLDIMTVVLSDFAENSYIVARQGELDCVVIDPGLEPKELVQKLKLGKYNVKAILVTHGHADHIGGIPYIRKEWPDAKIIIGENDENALTDPIANCSRMFGMDLITLPADKTVSDNEVFDEAGITFQAIDLPGHTRGHVIYLLELEGQKIAFVGDVIFRDSIGRTDLPGGSCRNLLNGIKNRIFTLNDDTILYTGHGPITKVGKEKNSNPFFN